MVVGHGGWSAGGVLFRVLCQLVVIGPGALSAGGALVMVVAQLVVYCSGCLVSWWCI